MPPAAAAAVLLALVAVLTYLNVYFLLASRAGWETAAKRLGVVANHCRIDTSSCAIVARTSWARVVFGIPNTVFGLAWCAALAWLAIAWLRTGTLFVPWWAGAAAAATVGAAVLLIWALRVRLQQPCPM